MMKNKFFIVGMLVTVLVFAATVLGCDDGGDTNYLDTFGLSNTAPSSQALTAGGITQAQYDQILEAAGGGYKGWALHDGDMAMGWSGRSVANFESVADVLAGIFTEIDRDSGGGLHNAYGSGYDLDLFTSTLSEGGVTASAGTMLLYFY